MTIVRADFLRLLSTVKPALAGKGTIKGLDNIWFTPIVCSAYNGVIQLKVPACWANVEKPEIMGGIPGDVLISFLKSVSSDTIELDMGSALHVKAGASKLDLPILDAKENVCEFPELNEAVWDGPAIPEDLYLAIERAMVSVNKNSSLDAYTGILTEQGDEGLLNLYSTDNKSLSWEQVYDLSFKEWEPRLLLPGEFCTQLLRLADEDTHFISEEGYATIVNSDPTYLTTRLLDTVGAPKFAKVVEKHLGSVDTYYPIPTDLRSALERCELIKPDRGEEPVHIEIKKNKMNLSLEASGMLAKDQIATEHADAHCTIDSSLLLRAIDNYKEFAITDDCLILHGEEESYHMISLLQD